MSNSNPNTIDLSGLSRQYAARDLPGERMLKYREPGQQGPEEIRRDKKEFKKELEERERLMQKKDSVNKRLSIIDKETNDKTVSAKKSKPEVNLDADEILPDSDDDNASGKSSNADSDSDADDDDDDDDTEALMAELNKIKKERAIEAAKQEADRKVKEEKIRVENILKGNPLLQPGTKGAAAAAATTPAGGGAEFKVKRRWDDDVVFKNCAKMDDGKKKDFINDTLRSEFHRKFMDRYVH